MTRQLGADTLGGRAPRPSPGPVEQLRQSDEIVGGCGEGKSEADPGGAPEPGLALAGDRLDPAEGLLDAFADALADGITGMARRPSVDRRASIAGVLRH